MTSDVDSGVVTAVRALYKKDERARRLFDRCAERERDTGATRIEYIAKQLNISRGDSILLAKKLQDTRCGEFVLGRRGQKSRFVWAYSCISLGKAAAGETSLLEQADDPLPEAEDEPGADFEPAPASPTRMTISEAKRILALSLDVPVDAIEITVRG